VVPHAPVLLLRDGGIPPSDRFNVDAETAVLISPHGSRSGVYGTTAGDLSGFGVTDVAVEQATNVALTSTIATKWGLPTLDEPLDHGAVVPLAMGIGRDLPVVICTLPEVTGPDAADIDVAIAEANRLAEILLVLEEDCALVCSAHGAASLSGRAPLLPNPSGTELQKRIREALSGDVSELLSIPTQLWREAGSCGAGPLTLFARVFEGRSSELLGEESPFGVGYIGAVVT
jgi:aromatic ring-opening dioxygenase LigB subunit